MSHKRAVRTTLFIPSLFRNLPRSATQRRKALCTAIEVSRKPLGNTAQTSFRLAPSDFAFLWEECKRCFYLKAHRQLDRPRAPFPAVFGTIDLGMKRHFRGLRTDQILTNMRPGIFLCEDDDAWVECQPIVPPGHTNSIYIRGMVSFSIAPHLLFQFIPHNQHINHNTSYIFLSHSSRWQVDCIVRYDDDTFGIVDFKTSSSINASNKYSRQLHAYARALEYPSDNSELVQGTVSDMGLVVYTPKKFHTPVDKNGHIAAALTGDLTYVPLERNDEEFLHFLSQVLDVLTLDKAPPPPPPKKSQKWRSSYSSCPYCQYLHMAEKGDFIH